MREKEKKEYMKEVKAWLKRHEKESRATELFDELVRLVNKHGIKRIFTTLEDICYIQSTNAEGRRKNSKLAKWWKHIGDQIGRIKTK